jgi:hypothetical protein
VWDDADRIYPNRVDLEFLDKGTNWGVAQLGRDALVGLRLSSNNRGAPVPVGTAFLPHELGVLASDVPTELGHTGDYDAYALVLIRREQSRLRSLKLGTNPTAACAICGRTLPSNLVRAAHIKRRADCTPAERDSLSNVLLACTLGCDELFERGYVAISDDFKVVVRPGLRGDIAEFLRGLEGRAVAGLNPGSGEFVKHHRVQHAFGNHPLGASS